MDLTLLDNQENGGGSTGTPDFNSPKSDKEIIEGSSNVSFSEPSAIRLQAQRSSSPVITERMS